MIQMAIARWAALKALWASGSLTVDELREEISAELAMALDAESLLTALEQDGFVQTRYEGSTKRFVATAALADLRQQALRDLASVAYHGDVDSLVEDAVSLAKGPANSTDKIPDGIRQAIEQISPASFESLAHYLRDA